MAFLGGKGGGNVPQGGCHNCPDLAHDPSQLSSFFLTFYAIVESNTSDLNT